MDMWHSNNVKVILRNFAKDHCFKLHKKWSFPLRISSINVTKSVMENSVFCAVYEHWIMLIVFIYLVLILSVWLTIKPNNLRKFILEFLKNMIKPPSSCRGSYDCLNNPCLSLHLSVTHFSQDLLSGFSQFFGWEYFVILKWQIQILENWIYGLDKSLNEKNSDQKQNIWHFSENNIIIVL